MCGPDCTMGVYQSDGMYCRLTSLQVAGPVEKAHANCTKILYGRRNSNVHWGPSSTKAVKCKPNNQHAKRVRSMLASLFLSKERHQILQDAKRKASKKMQALLGKKTVAAYYAAVRFRMKVAPMLSPVPESIPEAFVQYIIEQTDRIRQECTRRKIPCKRTDASLVLGLMQLLATGFSACGATLIPKSEFVRKHGLTLSQYGMMPNIRCRSQTISTRLVKKVILTEEGEPLLLLPEPPA